MLISIPKSLRETLGEEASEDLVELMNNFAAYSQDSITTRVEERFERRMAEELAKLKVEIIEQIHTVHTSTIRWMFLFWVGQIGALIGILFAFFR